jgi:hypothetical protein
MFYVWAFCHTTDTDKVFDIDPNTSEHIHVNTISSCCNEFLQIVYMCTHV